MFIKKLVAVVLGLSLVVSLTACSLDSAIRYTDTGEKVFQVEEHPVWIVLPKEWKENEMPNLDLQCELPDEGIRMSVLVYYDMDLAEDISGEDVFKIQNEQLLSLRDSVSEKEPISSTEDEEKIIYSCEYTAEKDGFKNIYNFNLIEFKDTGIMVWILFNGLVSDMIFNSEEFDPILSNVYDSDPET